MKLNVKSWSFTTEATAPDTKGAVKGEFANGFVAIAWKQGRTVHAKLYNKMGTEIGSQYGDSRCPFFTTWTFYDGGVAFKFNLVGPTKTKK